MTRPEEVWIPLVDEPIGTIVAQIQADHAEIDTLVDTPQRLLAFKTFAYIRVGLLLGELLLIPSSRLGSSARCGRSPKRSPATSPPRMRRSGPTRPRANASANLRDADSSRADKKHARFCYTVRRLGHNAP